MSEVSAELRKQDWANPTFYSFWMAQHWSLIRWTERFIHLACGSTPQHKKEQYAYWSNQLKEEYNHHKLLENDAKFFGVDLHRVPVLPETSALQSSIQLAIPATQGLYLYGYGTLLEGLSCEVGGWMLNFLTETYGKRSASFLLVHSEEDDGEDGHYQKVCELIGRMSAEDQRVIETAVTSSKILYSNMLKRAARVTQARYGSA